MTSTHAWEKVNEDWYRRQDHSDALGLWAHIKKHYDLYDIPIWDMTMSGRSDKIPERRLRYASFARLDIAMAVADFLMQRGGFMHPVAERKP
jgi:hypothetical protein